MAAKRTKVTPPTLSEQLRAAIVASGLSHYRLAKETGVSPPIITRFANGTRSISLETADRIVAYFQMNLSFEP
jgi:plasmid maintenance system antidote protein VapI